MNNSPSPAATPVISLERAGKRYGEVQALHDVDLEVHGGEVVAVLGPNGAGKSTAIHLMLGLFAPTSGRVRIFGGDPIEAENRVYTGAMLQSTQLPGNMKVRELIELFSSYYPAPLPVAETLSLSDLGALADRMHSRLSTGERQRVRFALAICGNPRLIFLDEPTVNLDVATRRRLWDCVRDLSSRRRTILLSSHYLEEADALATRVVLLQRGTVLQQGTPEQIKAQVAIQYASCRTRMEPEEAVAIPGVKRAMRNGTRLELRVDAGVPIARELYARDPDLQELTVREAGLEEAFMLLTNQDAKP